MSGFTPEQRKELRELLIVHTVARAACPTREDRHYRLFYAEMDARSDELARMVPAERLRSLAAIGREAHEQELAEWQADERAASPTGMSTLDRIDAFSRRFGG